MGERGAAAAGIARRVLRENLACHPVNDLTPQLRTRLSRVERAAGLFVVLAAVVFFAGFGYYVYHTAQRKGWFVTTVTYCTTIYSGAGLTVGDPVKLWGFNVGEITKIDTQPPDDLFNVYVEFTVREPYFGYLWTEGTKVRIAAADFLGKRALEVTKGNNYCPTHLVWPVKELSLEEAVALPELSGWLALDSLDPTGADKRVLEPLDRAKLKRLLDAGVSRVRLADRTRSLPRVTMVWNFRSNLYEPYLPSTKPYWLPPDESQALTERLDGLINQADQAIAGYLPLVMSNTVQLTANASFALAQTQPLLTNLSLITANLTNTSGSLGEWLIPAPMQAQLLTTLTNADGTLTNASSALSEASAMMAAASSNLTVLVTQLEPPLQSLSSIISNLNNQVQANTNFVATVSDLLIHTDELIQGFKRHWFLRGAFKETPTNPPSRSVKRIESPKGSTQR